MIKVDGQVLEISRFPDGTPKIDIELQHKNKSSILFVWTYENDAELIYLAMAKGIWKKITVIRGSIWLCLMFQMQGWIAQNIPVKSLL